jgi:hypothetical protein
VQTATNQAIHYVSQPNTSATHTFTAQATMPGLGVLAFEGAALTSPLDQRTSGAAATLTITTMQANEMVIATNYPSTGNNPNIGLPFETQIRFITSTAPVAIGMVVATILQSAAGPISATFSGSAGNMNQLVSFRGAIS